MALLDKIITVGIGPHPIEIPVPEVSFMEMWNPKVSELNALIPFLEDNKKILYVWCYGFTKDKEYDYSRVYSNRIAMPMWLGETKEQAYELYTKAFKQLVAGTIVNEVEWEFKK